MEGCLVCLNNMNNSMSEEYECVVIFLNGLHPIGRLN